MLADVAEKAEAIKLGHVQVNNGTGKIVLCNPVPGGFAILGFLLAGKRVMEKRLEERAAAHAEPATA